MSKSHESKLFVVETEYYSGRNVAHVFRTRAAARRFRDKQKAKKSVWFSVVVSAVWGPDA